MRRLLCALFICACLPFASAAAQTPANPREVAHSIAAAIEEAYYDEERASVIAAEVRQRAAAGELDRHQNPMALATALTGVLKPHDGHFNVVWTAASGPVAAGGQSDATMRFLEASARGNYGFRAVQVFHGRVGYINLDHFAMLDAADASDPARRAADAALALLADAQAIIIDLRDNVGGAPPMVSYLASYFTPANADIFNTFRSRMGEMSEAPTIEPTGARRLDAPLFILISGRTGSAAESFAYTLQAAGRAVIVGEPSAGAANPGAFISVGRGFSVFVSRASPANPITGGNWEGAGVLPDVGVAYADTLRQARILALRQIAPAQEQGDARTEAAWALDALEIEPRPLPVRAARAYVGDYGQRSVALMEGGLVLLHDRRPPAALVPIGPDLFRVADNPTQRVQFERDEQGRVAVLVHLYASAAASRHARL